RLVVLCAPPPPRTCTLSLHDALPISFQSAPERLAQAARDTEDKLATRLYAGASGPVSAFFTASGGTVDNKPLTVDNLSAALTTIDRKSTRLNSSHDQISYAVFCLKKK